MEEPSDTRMRGSRQANCWKTRSSALTKPSRSCRPDTKAVEGLSIHSRRARNPSFLCFAAQDLHAAEARALGDALDAMKTRGSVSGVSGASRSTEDIEKEHSVDSALDEDLAEELMSVTFAKPFQKTRTDKHSSEFHSTSEESTDGPGQYVVIKDTGFDSETADFPGSQDGMAYIRAGAIVEVVEVGGQKPDRLQGRILAPPGWISLLDTESGYRWACKVEVGGEHVESKAPSTPRASLVVLPASHDKISTVCRKPRPKAIHRRAWPKDVKAPFQLARNAQPKGEFKA
eukprot:s1053_g20.t5